MQTLGHYNLDLGEIDIDFDLEKITNDENHGFSLIELVVVVVVLAILSRLGMPAYMYLREKAADTLVQVSLKNSFKECKLAILNEHEVPKFTLDFGLHNQSYFYKFYQTYLDVTNEDGSKPPIPFGHCSSPYSPSTSHSIGVKKLKGRNNVGGELWINLDTGVLTEKGGLVWN